MSFQAMAWAVKQKVGNATGKAILLMLANYADEKGECFPSQETLANECECSVATVARWVKHFEDHGILSRHKQYGEGGYRRADRLRLASDLPVTELPSRELPNSEPKLTRQKAGAEPIREPISSLRSDNISIKPDFDREFETEFWPVYPRKVGKGQALKAYRAARKQSDCQTITAGARRYAAERAGQDQQFTRHAATWLNGQGWLDEPASKPSPRSQAPPLTPHQQRHQAAIDAFDRRLGVKRDDEFTGNTLDLERSDFRSH